MMRIRKKYFLFFNLLLLVSSLIIVMIILEIILRIVFPNGYHAYRPDPNVQTTGEYSYHLFENSWGVRDREYNQKELTSEKILLLGDSMTYGVGVEAEDSFAKVTERILNESYPRLLVVNGGGKATGTVRQFEFLRELLKKHAFKAVGFCFYLGNDSDNNLEDMQNSQNAMLVFSRDHYDVSIIRDFLIIQYLFRNSILFNFTYVKFRIFLYKFRLIKFFQGKDVLRREYSERGKMGWVATRNIMEKIREFAQVHRETKIFFVLLPQDFQVDPEKQKRFDLSSEKYDFFKPNRILASILDENGIPYLDTTLAFIRHYEKRPEKKLFFTIDRHLNESGHELIAEVLVDYLISNFLSPSSSQKQLTHKRFAKTPLICQSYQRTM